MEFTLPLLLTTVIATIAAWRELRADPQGRHGLRSHIALYAGLLWAVLACFSAISYGGHGRISSQWTSCISTMKQTSTALHMYASDNDDRLPAAYWWKGTKTYLPDDLGGCASARKVHTTGTSKVDYAMNKHTIGAKVGALDETTLLLAEVRPGLPMAVTKSESEFQVRHQWRINLGRADGSVHGVTLANPKVMLWKPGQRVDKSKVNLPPHPDPFLRYREPVDAAHLTLLLFAWPIVFAGSIIGTYRAPRHRKEFWRLVFTLLLCLVALVALILPFGF